MNVQVAVQVLSSTVSAAIWTTIDSNELQTQTASTTANFVELMHWIAKNFSVIKFALWLYQKIMA